MRTNSRPVARAIDLPSEVLPTPGGPTRQRIGPFELVGAALHGEVLDDAVLDLLQAEVIGVEHLLGEVEVVLDLRLLAPRDAEQPVEIVAHDRRFRRHRAHLAELLQLVLRLLAGFLGELGLGDLLLELGSSSRAVLGVAELLLDRLHLLVEIVLALRLLHLALDARADALLDLEHRDLALHQAEHALQPLDHGRQRQDRLLLGDLDGEVRGDGVGDLGIVVDLGDRADDLGRDLLVELHVVLELGDDGARQRLDLDLVADRVGQLARMGLVIALVVRCSGGSRRGRRPRPAPSRCRRAASGAAGRRRACRPCRSSRASARPRSGSAGWRAGSACRRASPPRARGSTSRARRRAARSCAGKRRCRGAAGPGKSPSPVGNPIVPGLFGHFRLFLSSPAPFGAARLEHGLPGWEEKYLALGVNRPRGSGSAPLGGAATGECQGNRLGCG